MTRTIVTALFLAGAVAPAAGQVKNPDIYTELTIGDVDSMDPAWSYDTASHEVQANVYEYLIAFKPGSTTEFEPRLAAKVPSRANGLISGDGLTFSFPIRKGVKFHDGGDLTAEDVRYSLVRFMLFDRDGGPSALLLEPILGLLSTRDEKGNLLPGLAEKADKAVRVEGDKVVIRLAKPFAPFLSIVANFGAIVSKRWCAANGAWDGTAATVASHNNPKKEDSPLHERANGTGAFKLERLDRRSKEVVLLRFDEYWRGPAVLKRVVRKVIDEFQTRRLMLQNGDADSIYAPQMMFSQLTGMPGVELIDGLENLERSTTLFFAFKINPVANPNIGSGKLDGEGIPPDFFTDKDIRKAFSYAIDYQAYIKDVMRGKGRPARGYIPRGMPGHDPKAPPYELDLAKAAEHFKKAWGGQVWEKGFACTLMFNDGQPNIITLANMIKKNVESLNPKFRMDVRTVQWSTFLEQSQANKVPIFVGAWQADYPDPHNFAYPLLHSKGYYAGKTGFGDPRFDDLISQAVSETRPGKREKLYRRLMEMAREETPSVPIADGLRFRTQRSWVKGFKYSPVFPGAPYSSYFYDLKKQG